jgi:hypothetical protein
MHELSAMRGDALADIGFEALLEEQEKVKWGIGRFWDIVPRKHVSCYISLPEAA